MMLFAAMLALGQAVTDVGHIDPLDAFIAAIPAPIATPRAVDETAVARLATRERPPEVVWAALTAFETCRYERGIAANRAWLRRVAATMPLDAVRKLTAFYASADYRRMREIMTRPASRTSRAEHDEAVRIGQENGADAFYAASRQIPNSERSAAEAVCAAIRDTALRTGAR